MQYFAPPNPAWFTSSGTSQLNSVEYSQDGRTIAFSKDSYSIDIVSVFDGNTTVTINHEITDYPVFDIEFHPTNPNILIAGFTDGSFVLFDQKGDIVNMVQHKGSQLLLMGIDSFGEKAALAFADSSIRLYDLEMMKRTVILQKRINNNSVQQQNDSATALIFNPTDPNIILSSTALNKVQIWDIRTGNLEGYLTGPLIRGPGLSMYDQTILTVSSRDSKPLELWDFGTLKKVGELSNDSSLSYFAGKIARNGMEIVVSSTSGMVSLYNYDNLNLFGQVQTDKGLLTALSISPLGSSFSTGSSTGVLSLYPIRVVE